MEELSIQNIANLKEILALSFSEEIDGVFVFKHSTRCSISSMAYNRLKREWNFDSSRVKFYYLDLLAHRDISNEIAETWNVRHESPQLIGLKDGKVIYEASHNMIYTKDIQEALNK